MSFPRYPEYKDSGNEWLGKVPAHWAVVKLGLLGVFKGGAGFPDEYQGQTDLEIPFFKVADISRSDPDGALRTANHTISSDTAHHLRARVFPTSTIIFAKVGAALLLQRYRWLGQPSCIDNNMMGLMVNERCVPRFLLHVLPLLDLSLIANPGAVPSINEEQISNQRAALPSLSEQAAIAAFLDKETAKIDALVAEQQRLIELLREKRHAVISHAVTKGLAPDIPMRASGIKWMGEVPAHWGVSKMKWIAKMESGHTPDKKVQEYWENGDIPWVSLNDTGYLKEHDYISDTAFHTTELGIANSSAHLLPARAVVFSRDATIGRCAITTRPMAVSQHFIAWICGDSVIPEYLLLVLRSMSQELDSLTTGATLKTIGMPEVRTLVTPVPPREEQEAIIRWCSDRARALDALTAEAQRAIDLLQERRAALISAAVTGQIDVRGIAERTAA